MVVVQEACLGRPRFQARMLAQDDFVKALTHFHSLSKDLEILRDFISPIATTVNMDDIGNNPEPQLFDSLILLLFLPKPPCSHSLSSVLLSFSYTFRS